MKRILAPLTIILASPLQADPAKDVPKVEIMITSDEIFEIAADKKDPKKQYTEDFYDWRYVTASLSAKVGEQVKAEVKWAVKKKGAGARSWLYATVELIDLKVDQHATIKGLAPEIRDLPAFLASSDGKNGVPWKVEGFVICVTDKFGKVLAIESETPGLVEAYRQHLEEEKKKEK